MAAVCATVCDWLVRMTEQRRLAAIVLADVAGYSRLMGLDDSGKSGASPRCPRLRVRLLASGNFKAGEHGQQPSEPLQSSTPPGNPPSM